MYQNIIALIANIDWSSFATAAATIVLAILTFVYVRLTRRILEAQSSPCVVVSVMHDDNRSSILQLVVRNIGTGIAYDITFEFSKPIAARAWGMKSDTVNDPKLMDYGPLINGIPALGPGEDRRIDWGQYGGLIKSIGDEPIVVKCSFKRDGKQMPPMICKLDVKSFEGTNASETPQAKSAHELERIAKELEHLGKGFHKLSVKLVEEK